MRVRVLNPLAMLLLALALAGCDKCGDWFGPASAAQVCKDDTRR
jgi:hypothetical protein